MRQCDRDANNPPDDAAAVLQIAVNDCVLGQHVYVFHLSQLCQHSPKRLQPRSLAQFLMRNDVIFCGRQLGGDRAALTRQFENLSALKTDGDDNLPNWVGLGALASHPEVRDGRTCLDEEEYSQKFGSSSFELGCPHSQ